MIGAERQKTILLVDDEVIVAMAEKSALEKYGYKVITAHSGEEAVALVEKTLAIDLILMDINLGDGMDGTEAAAIILNERDIPVVFLSSHMEPEVVAKTEKITSYGYVVKNSSITVLDASIKMAFKLFQAKKQEMEKEAQMATALEALKVAEETYRNIFLNAQTGLFRTEIKTGLLLDANDCVARFIGYEDREKLLEKPFNIAERYVDIKDRERMISLLNEYGHFDNLEARFRRNDGSIIWMRFAAKMVPEKGWTEGVSEDITKEKAMEESLRDGESRYRSILNTSPDGISITDMNGRILMASPALVTMIGCEREEEMLGRLFSDFVSPDDRERVAFKVALIFKGTMMGLSEYHGLRADGSFVDLEVNGEFVRNAEGRPTQMIFIIRDISERKQAEFQMKAALEALKVSETRAQALLRTIPDLLFRVNRQGVFLDYKADIKDLYIQSGASIIGKRFQDILPLELADLIDLKIRSTLETGRLQTFEYQLPVPNQGERDYEARMMVSGTDEVTAIIRDITEYNLAEKTLQKSEMQLKAMLDNSPVVVLLIQEGKLIYINHAAEKMTGWQEEDFIGKNFINFVHKDDTEIVIKKNRERMSGNSFLAPYVLRINKKSGGFIYAEVNGTVIDLDGKPTMLGFLTDITDRKRADEALRQSEAQLSNALQMTKSGHWEYDVDRDLFTFNDNFYRIFRTTAAAMGGYQMSSEDYARRFCHPDDMAVVGDENRAALETSDPNYSRQIEHRILYADGEVGWIAVRFFIIKDPQGRTVKTYGVNQDITERKQAEKEIKRQLAEKETLLKEVHHRIKNNIASISGLISLHMQTVTNPQAVAVLKDAVGRVDSMRILYDKLLLSEDYKDVSVKKYLDDLIDSIFAIFPNKAKIVLEKRIEDFHLNAKQLFPVGVIINEILTNTMKHAFSKRPSGLIEVALIKDKNHVTLTIQNNGKKLPAGFDINESKGFGLMLVKMLSQQLGGTFSMESQKGTRCKVEFDI